MHVVCTAHDEPYQALATVTLPSVQRYADRHKYALYYDPKIPPRMKDACKAAIFLDLYASGKFSGDDLFLWVDTDALIMNSAIKLEELAFWCRFHEGKHFGWGTNWDGPNSGVWLARFTSHAAHFIQVYDQTARGMGWGDNYGMVQTMLLPPFRDWVSCIPGKFMNAAPYELYGIEDWPHKNEINNYEKGDFILHLPGLHPEARMRELQRYAKLTT